jgi:hypothetical protein
MMQGRPGPLLALATLFVSEMQDGVCQNFSMPETTAASWPPPSISISAILFCDKQTHDKESRGILLQRITQ